MNILELLDCEAEQNPTMRLTQEGRTLCQLLNSNQNLSESFNTHFNTAFVPRKMISIMEKIGNPREKLQKLHLKTTELTSSIASWLSLQSFSYYIVPQDMNASEKEAQNHLVPESESLMLMYKRWYKLQKDLCDKSKQPIPFNISKIPDIYDSINYDIKHNKGVLEYLYPNYGELLQIAQQLAYFVVPNEYGVARHTKVETAKKIVTPLCKKIFNDLMFWKDNSKNVKNGEEQYWKYIVGAEKTDDCNQWRHVRTRLYFTSSSHIYSIYNILAYGNNGALLNSCEKQVSEKVRKLMYIGYLSHIELKLFENLHAQKQNKNRFRLELSFSPMFEINNDNVKQNMVLGHSGFTIEEIEGFFKTVLGEEWIKQ